MSKSQRYKIWDQIIKTCIENKQLYWKASYCQGWRCLLVILALWKQRKENLLEFEIVWWVPVPHSETQIKKKKPQFKCKEDSLGRPGLRLWSSKKNRRETIQWVWRRNAVLTNKVFYYYGKSYILIFFHNNSKHGQLKNSKSNTQFKKILIHM